jgi:hypothetical protein
MANQLGHPAVTLGSDVVPSQGTLVVTATSAAASLALLYEAMNEASRPQAAVTLGGAALAAWAITLACLAKSSGSGSGITRWNIGPWTLLWCGVTSGLATMTWWQPPAGGVDSQIAVASILRALWLVAVAITAWAAGYLPGSWMPLRRLAARGVGALDHRRDKQIRSLVAPWVLYAIGTSAQVVQAAGTGRFGYLGNAASAVSGAPGYGGLLSALASCAPLAVGAAALQVFREGRREARLSLVALFTAQIVMGAVAGGKGSFVIAVLAVVIPWTTAGRKPSNAAVTWLAVAAAAFLLIVIPFNQAYRATARGGTASLTPGQALSAAPGVLSQVLAPSALTAALPESLHYLGQRIQEINSPAIILQRTPSQIPYLSPVDMIRQPVAAATPRFLWPGKPVLDGGYEFGQEYFGLPAAIYTSTPDTPAGSLYRYGGWLPVIVGMMLLGAGIRVLDDVLRVSNPHAFFMLLLLLPAVAGGEEDWGTLLGSIPAVTAVWATSILLAFRHRRKSASAA